MKRLLPVFLLMIFLLSGCSLVSYTGLNAMVLSVDEASGTVVVRDTDGAVSPVFGQSCAVQIEGGTLVYFDSYRGENCETQVSRLAEGDILAIDLTGSEKRRAGRGECASKSVHLLCSSGVSALVLEARADSVIVSDPPESGQSIFGSSCEIDCRMTRIVGIDHSGGEESILDAGSLLPGDSLEITLSTADKKRAAEGSCRAEEILLVAR